MPSHFRGLRVSSFFPLLFLLVIAQSIWIHRNGGHFNPEHFTTLPHYLSQKPLLRMLFDPLHNEAPPSPDNFQARELSYFTDYLDACCLLLFSRLGMASLLSVMKYLFVAGTVWVGWRGFVGGLGLPRSVAGLLLLLFLTSSPVFYDCFYHRTAKVAVCFTAFAALISAARFLLDPSSLPSRRKWIFHFSLLSAMALFDMQGFFLLGLFDLLLFGGTSIRSTEKLHFLSSSALAALCVHLCYRYWLGFEFVEFFNGYRPLHPYQNLNWAALDLTQLPKAVALFVDYFRLFFGSIPFAGGAVLLLASLVWQLSARSGEGVTGQVAGVKFRLCPIGLAIAMSYLGLIVMFFLEGSKFHYIYKPALRLRYYSLPTEALFLFCAGLTISQILRRHSRAKPALCVALSCLVLSNYLALDRHRSSLEEAGEGNGRYMEDLVTSLRAGRIVTQLPASETAGYLPKMRGLDCQSVPECLARDPVFLTLNGSAKPSRDDNQR